MRIVQPLRHAYAEPAETAVSRTLSAAIFLLLLTVLWSPSQADGGSSAMDLVRYGLFGLFGVAVVVLSYFHCRQTGARMVLPTGPALLALFILYSVVSVFWTGGSTNSIIKGVLLLTALGLSIAASAARSNRELVRLIVAASVIFTVLGFVVSLFVPSVGIETGWLLEGKWRGLSGQKNAFGAIAAVSLVASFVLLADGRPGLTRRALLRALALGFFTMCLFFSGSRGAQMIAIVGIAAALFARLPRRWQDITLFAAAVTVLPFLVLAATTFSTQDTQLSFAGLTFDTSNRTEIWAFGLEGLRGHEVFGVGLANFWTPDNLDIFKANHGWVLDNFHNGYMTILVEGGLFGLSLFLAGIVGSFSLLRLMSRDQDPTTVFAWSFFCMMASHNVIENTFGRSTSFFFVSFLLIVFSAYRASKAPFRQPASPRVSVREKLAD